MMQKKDAAKKVYETKDGARRKRLEFDLKRMEGQLLMAKDNLSLQIKKAMAELLLGKPEKAIESSKQAVFLDEKSFYGWYVLGCCYFDAGMYSCAKDAYEEAMKKKIDPECKLPYASAVQDILHNLQFIAVIEKTTPKH